MIYYGERKDTKDLDNACYLFTPPKTARNILSKIVTCIDLVSSFLAGSQGKNIIYSLLHENTSLLS